MMMNGPIETARQCLKLKEEKVMIECAAEKTRSRQKVAACMTRAIGHHADVGR